MVWTAERKQAVAFYVFFLNPLHGLLKKWSAVMPQGWEVLPYLIDFVITAIAFILFTGIHPISGSSPFG